MRICFFIKIDENPGKSLLEMDGGIEGEEATAVFIPSLSSLCMCALRRMPF